MESLGRGVVPIKQNNGKVFVSWRVLGTDEPKVGFNFYRSPGGKTVRLNAQTLIGPTHFVDSEANFSHVNAYFVPPVLSGP